MPEMTYLCEYFLYHTFFNQPMLNTLTVAIILFVFSLLLTSCYTLFAVTPNNFDAKKTPQPPDYSSADDWAALPDQSNPSDWIPRGSEVISGAADVDIFYIYPTMHSTPLTVRNDKWNASLRDKGVNLFVDKFCIRGIASVFNTAGRIYAPRYRQAHAFAYLTRDKKAAAQAFDLAYKDVKTSFDYYMQHYNAGRPIIIAAHSQGTNHAIRLLKDYFDEKPLYGQLVAAYLVGMPVEKGYFKQIKPSQSPTDVGVFASWRTFKTGTRPEKQLLQLPAIVYLVGDKYHATNPLTWRSDTSEYAPSSLNKGGYLVQKIVPNCADAQLNNGVLWTKLSFRRALFVTLLLPASYHLLDYQLFYNNIKENAVLRAKVFVRQKKQQINQR